MLRISLRPALLSLSIMAAIGAGCAPVVRVHGYVPSQADIGLVQPGVDDFTSVDEKLGRPSSSGLLQDNSWYYVQSVVESYTYNAPRVVDRTVLAVNFNDNGVVDSLVEYGLEDGRIINLTARTTETGGRTLGVVEQLFGNILNIDAESLSGQ